jgi:sortase A
VTTIETPPADPPPSSPQAEDAEAEAASATRPAAPAPADSSAPAREKLGWPRVTALVAIWTAVAFACLLLVLYFLEPYFQQNTQRHLLERYRVQVTHSANQANGLQGVEVAKKPVAIGAPMAILEIPKIHLRQVVVEGASSEQTQGGPGHVRGTAGPGQKGNTVFVARRATFGGPFGRLGSLHRGDRILVTTTQGQSVFQVTTVRKQSDPASLEGPTEGNRLTLMTSASAAPWNDSRAQVVLAELRTVPFQKTPQGSSAGRASGTSGDASAWWMLGLVTIGYLFAIGAAVFAYRRASSRAAYLLTAAPLIAFTVLFAEYLSRLLPAWM